jgi:HEPN domain-containing protein
MKKLTREWVQKAESGDPVPRTHDLDQLLNLLSHSYPTLRSLRRGLRFLSDYAVDFRYPGKRGTKRRATAALRWSGRVRDACRALLGIRARPGRKSP